MFGGGRQAGSFRNQFRPQSGDSKNRVPFQYSARDTLTHTLMLMPTCMPGIRV